MDVAPYTELGDFIDTLNVKDIKIETNTIRRVDKDEIFVNTEKVKNRIIFGISDWMHISKIEYLISYIFSSIIIFTYKCVLCANVLREIKYVNGVKLTLDCITIEYFC